MRLIVLILYSVLFSFKSDGQELSKKRGWFYYDDVRYEEYEDIKPIIASNQEALYWIEKSRSTGSSSYNLGVVSVIGLGGSLYMMYTASKDGSETTLGLAIYGLGLAAVSSMFGIAALIKGSKAKMEEQKGMDIFNNKNLESSLIPKTDYYFSINVQPNGLTIGMTF
ncbi:MAG: hypothetical protein AAGA77_07225 [Bacteroidota bacterium]